MLRRSSQRTVALPAAHRALAAPSAPQVMKNCLAIRDRGQMIAFVGADRKVPNEAKRLLKTRDHALASASKAKKSLKIQHLSLQSQETIEKSGGYRQGRGIAMALMRKGTSAATAIANRANALKSTGPVTGRGQSISRLNAAKHWGRAETIRPTRRGLAQIEDQRLRCRRAIVRTIIA